MKKVKKKIRNVRSIRMLFIFDYVIMLALAVSFFYLGFFSLVTYIFLALLTVCISLQLILHFVPKGELVFDVSGITIITKKTNIFVCWNDVKHIYYNSFSEWFPLLSHCTIDMRMIINGEIIDFDERYGNINISKEEYMNIVSFIPKNILESNDWMIYKNIVEKENNSYGI